MSDKPTSTDAAWAGVLRDRRADLLHERELIEARLAEVNELLRLIETPAARQRRPRQLRAEASVPEAVPEGTEGEGVPV